MESQTFQKTQQHIKASRRQRIPINVKTSLEEDSDKGHSKEETVLKEDQVSPRKTIPFKLPHLTSGEKKSTSKKDVKATAAT